MSKKGKGEVDAGDGGGGGEKYFWIKVEIY